MIIDIDNAVLECGQSLVINKLDSIGEKVGEVFRWTRPTGEEVGRAITIITGIKIEQLEENDATE